jgi:hypothetical protein
MLALFLTFSAMQIPAPTAHKVVATPIAVLAVDTPTCKAYLPTIGAFLTANFVAVFVT